MPHVLLSISHCGGGKRTGESQRRARDWHRLQGSMSHHSWSDTAQKGSTHANQTLELRAKTIDLKRTFISHVMRRASLIKVQHGNIFRATVQWRVNPSHLILTTYLFTGQSLDPHHINLNAMNSWGIWVTGMTLMGDIKRIGLFKAINEWALLWLLFGLW